MGLGKKWKRFAGTVGKAVGDATGSEFLGRTTAFAVGGGGGMEAIGGLAGGGGGLSGYSMVEREQTRAKNAMATAENLQNIEAQKNAQIAEEQRQKTLLQADIQKQIEEERKRTTFAGSTMQGITERKRLLGV